MNLESALKHMPERFEFYGLGPVEEQPEHLTTLTLETDLPSFGYSIRGDFSGFLILQYQDTEDFSLFAEMGNIFASRLADQMDSCWISPARSLTATQLTTLLMCARESRVQNYVFTRAGRSIPLKIALLSSPPQEAGHA